MLFCYSLAQQCIQQLIRKDYKNIEAILEPPAGQDDASWKYEHLRLFCSELNGLAVRLQEECDPKVVHNIILYIQNACIVISCLLDIHECAHRAAIR